MEVEAAVPKVQLLLGGGGEGIGSKGALVSVVQALAAILSFAIPPERPSTLVQRGNSGPESFGQPRSRTHGKVGF